MSSAVLVEGKNVWRIAHADRVSLVVDGAAYFDAFTAAIKRARHSIMILSWDIDSQTDLHPDAEEEKPLIEELAEIHVETYILNWDYAPIYTFEREQVPQLRFRSRSRPNIHFALDAKHPYCASHHQKVVVIDDAIAFCGGLDLTTHRWDTPEHIPQDPRRVDARGKIYTPFHDVQIAVDGEAARCLGALARERWFRAKGEKLQAPPAGSAPWPEELAVDLTDVRLGIARTEPAYDGRPEIREAETAFLDSIRCAEKYVYAETQYLSSKSVRDAVAERLQEPDGPEIVLVTPRECCGWMEKQTIGVITRRLVRELRDRDGHGRLQVLAPKIGDVDVFVHSKVMVVDDRLFRVGSANLSNRSMGVDSECDILIEADDERVSEGIRRMRNRLLAEHLDTTPEEFQRAMERDSSLLSAISAFDGERKLVPAHVEDDGEKLLIPEEVADPTSPIDPEQLMKAVAPSERPRAARRRTLRLAFALAVLIGMALAWRFTPLSQLIELDQLIAWGRTFAVSPFAPLVVVAVYAIGTTLMVPVNLLLVATGVVFGPLYGAIYAVLGSLSGAAAGYFVGRAIGADTVHAIIGRKVHRLASILHRRGIIAFTTVRLVPIASFGLVNMLGGAMRIRFVQFLIGTLIGMAPGITITVLFGGQLAKLISSVR